MATAVGLPPQNQAVASPFTAGAAFVMPDFPATLPVVRLTPEQMSEMYGLRGSFPARLEDETAGFERWSKQDVRLDRSLRYARAVRDRTFQVHVDQIRAYLGYIRMYGRRQDQDLSLTAYAEPASFAGFIAYLMRRNVGRHHLIKHVSLARKVNNYLSSGDQQPPAVMQFTEAMDAWLQRLESQVAVSMPRQPKSDAPDAVLVFRWVEGLMAAAKQMMAAGMKAGQRPVSYAAAWQVQCAVIASLVTGSHVPPCRLSIIKTALHPAFNGKIPCPHPDCKAPSTCAGNRFEVVGSRGDPQADAAAGSSSAAQEGTQRRTIRFVAPHHKNEGRGYPPIEYMLPAGDLVDMLLAHIDNNHVVLTLAEPNADYNPYLFVSRSGANFTDATFSQFWAKLMATAPSDLPRFTANAARTAFVDDYSGAYGVPPEMWDGAATAMGSSQGQWNVHTYRPSAMRRKAQAAVDYHSNYRESLRRRTEGSGL